MLGKQESGQTKLSQSHDKDRGGRSGGHSRGRGKHGGGAKFGDSGQISGGGDEIDNDGRQSGDKGTQSCGDENFGGGQSSNKSAGQSKSTNGHQSDSDNVGQSGGGGDQLIIDGGQSSNNNSEETGEIGHQSGQSGGDGQSSDKSRSVLGSDEFSDKVDQSVDNNKNSKDSQVGVPVASDLDQISDKAGEARGEIQFTRF